MTQYGTGNGKIGHCDDTMGSCGGTKDTMVANRILSGPVGHSGSEMGHCGDTAVHSDDTTESWNVREKSWQK